MLKHISILLILFFIQVVGWSQLNITKIADSVVVFTTYHTYNNQIVSAHGLLIQTPNGIAMIDTPWDSTQFQPLLDSVKSLFNQPVIFVFSTHWHDDRTAGLNYYANKGIPTYSTCATKQLCIENHNPIAKHCITADSIFNFGSRKIECYYPGAGHSSDNMVVYLPKEKILYGGCFIKSIDSKDLGNLHDANLGMWPIALKNLEKKYPHVKRTIPGHFELKKGSKGKKLIRFTRKLIRYKFKGKQVKLSKT